MLVKVHAAAITFNELLWDETWSRDGQDRTPIIPSHEWSGVVAEADRRRVWGGRRRLRDGAVRPRRCGRRVRERPADFVATKPATLSHVEAAALPLAGLTAWQAVADHAHVARGDSVLVLGAAGGVGSFAVQLALQLGAQVTATAMERDREFVRALGPVDVVVATDRGAHGDELEPGTFDVVVDTVGGDLMEAVAPARASGRLLRHAPAAAAARPGRRLGRRGDLLRRPADALRLDRLRESVEQGDWASRSPRPIRLGDGRQAFESGALPGRSPGKTVLVVRADDVHAL